MTDQTNKETMELVLNAINAVAGKSPSTPRANIFLEGLIDSFGMLQLIAEIEKITGIEIGDEALTISNFASAEDISKLVESYKQ